MSINGCDKCHFFSVQHGMYRVDDGATESVSRSSRDNREMEPSSYAT
jgi:hypothetical protein